MVVFISPHSRQHQPHLPTRLHTHTRLDSLTPLRPQARVQSRTYALIPFCTHAPMYSSPYVLTHPRHQALTHPHSYALTPLHTHTPTHSRPYAHLHSRTYALTRLSPYGPKHSHPYALTPLRRHTPTLSHSYVFTPLRSHHKRASIRSKVPMTPGSRRRDDMET